MHLGEPCVRPWQVRHRPSISPGFVSRAKKLEMCNPSYTCSCQEPAECQTGGRTADWIANVCCNPGAFSRLFAGLHPAVCDTKMVTTATNAQLSIAGCTGAVRVAPRGATATGRCLAQPMGLKGTRAQVHAQNTIMHLTSSVLQARADAACCMQHQTGSTRCFPRNHNTTVVLQLLVLKLLPDTPRLHGLLSQQCDDSACSHWVMLPDVSWQKGTPSGLVTQATVVGDSAGC